jgi:hypothetical protein
MSSPPASRNGSAPRRGTLADSRRHADLMTRLGSWARLMRVAARRLLNRPPASPGKPAR